MLTVFPEVRLKRAVITLFVADSSSWLLWQLLRSCRRALMKISGGAVVVVRLLTHGGLFQRFSSDSMMMVMMTLGHGTAGEINRGRSPALLQSWIVHQELVDDPVGFLVDAVISRDRHRIDRGVVRQTSHGRIANQTEFQTGFGDAGGKQRMARQGFSFVRCWIEERILRVEGKRTALRTKGFGRGGSRDGRSAGRGRALQQLRSGLGRIGVRGKMSTNRRR